MVIARRQFVLLALCALMMILLLALLAWITTAERDRSGLDLARNAPSQPVSVGTPPELRAPAAEEPAPERTEINTPAPPKPTPPPVQKAPALAPGATVALVAKFARPDKSDVELASGVLELRDSKGTLRREELHQAKSVRLTGLVPSMYVARVIAPDFDHRPQFLDLTKIDEATRRGNDEPVFEKRLVCWPSQWIAVIVETSDGRPLAELARDLDTDPVKLFVGAFHVHTQLEAPRVQSTQSSAYPSEIQSGESALARFRPPPDYKSWEITRSCVGSLELLHAPPMWVELELFGKPVGWESLQPGAREIVFRIDRSALDERFASVTARVVDPKDKAPVANALVTLRADTSAHRRADQTNVPTDAKGRILFERVVPGRYEFQVARGESQHQQMIELSIGEQRDLGDIALGEGQGIDVLVVDEHGKPMHTYLEIGPYRKGARSTELYPQMMRHSSGNDGKGKLPMPSEPAIIRAAVESGRSNGPAYSQEVRGVRSLNVLIDPHSPPTETVKLVARRPVNVTIATNRTDGVRIEVLDELDVVVARSVHDTDKKLGAELVPGSYRARTIGADGTAGLEVPFTADGKQAEIQVD